MSPALNGSSVIQRFKHSNAIEPHYRITFDFYTGLSHVWQSQIEIGYYSVTYFERITKFDVL